MQYDEELCSGTSVEFNRAVHLPDECNDQTESRGPGISPVRIRRDPDTGIPEQNGQGMVFLFHTDDDFSGPKTVCGSLVEGSRHSGGDEPIMQLP